MTLSAIDEYIAITDQIIALKEKRDALKVNFEIGRNSGTVKDIRVSYIRTGAKICETKLRQYVTREIIDRCKVGGKTYKAHSVVPKLQPRKKKK